MALPSRSALLYLGGLCFTDPLLLELLTESLVSEDEGRVCYQTLGVQSGLNGLDLEV